MVARLIKRFARDDRGAFAVIFGMIAIVLTAMAGAVVDLVSVDQARNRVQIALDSAALALQPQIYSKDNEYLKTTALKLVKERVGDNRVTVEMATTDVSKDTDNGRLYLQAHVTVPMSFVALIGINQLETAVVSQVTRKKLNIEVAMVLDNSGSMGGQKIADLKSAAICATDILFYNTCTKPVDGWPTENPNTKVGIVPFAFFVNVGKSHANDSWVDKSGKSPIAMDNLNRDSDGNLLPSSTGIDRIALMESLAGTSYDWKGCFEERPYPYSVDDTPPDPSNPSTLFTPEFAPDEPGDAGFPKNGFNNSYIDDDGGNCPVPPKLVITQTKTGCSNNASYGEWAYNNCYSTPTTSYLLTHGDGTTSTAPVASTESIDGFALSSTSSSYSGYWVGSRWRGSYTNSRTITYNYGPSLTDRQLQDRICKYENATVKPASGTLNGYTHEGYTQGPNAGCPDAYIQSLTDQPATLVAQINAMKAEGGTNIQEGTAWGFRLLSPSEPFTEGRDYNTATSKVIILMTDGDNTYWHVDRWNHGWDTPNINGTYYYMPFGYQYNNRLSMNGTGPYANSDGNNLQLEMNKLTLETCTNAKKEGIIIYTVGLGTTKPTSADDGLPEWSKTGLMLRACASDPNKARFPKVSSELNDVFAGIAEELSALRIEK